VSHGARVWAALVTVYVIWGSTYLGIYYAGRTIPPLFAASTRFIASGTIMALVVVARGGSLRVSRRAVLSCLVIGCLLPGANSILFFAERNVPTGLASLIIASVPLWVAVLRLTRERLPWQVLAGIGVGFAGVAVLAQPSGGAKWWGVALCFCSAVMWATGSYLSSRLEMPADPFAATSLEMLAGGFAMLPLSLFTFHHLSPSAGSVAGWLYLVVFGSLVGYTAYVWLLANAPLGLVSTYAYVNPVIAIGLGVLFRGEHLTWRLLVGAAIVVVAVASVVRKEPGTAPPPDEGVRYVPEVELYAGRVVSVSDHPGARGPSYLVDVDLGGRGVRQAQMEPGSYAKDELEGTLVVVSLEEGEAIVLAARSHGGPRLLRPDGDVEPGTLVA
jgi:drug/metabolite transporter (DMT)-like permease